MTVSMMMAIVMAQTDLLGLLGIGPGGFRIVGVTAGASDCSSLSSPGDRTVMLGHRRHKKQRDANRLLQGWVDAQTAWCMSEGANEYALAIEEKEKRRGGGVVLSSECAVIETVPPSVHPLLPIFSNK